MNYHTIYNRRKIKSIPQPVLNGNHDIMFNCTRCGKTLLRWIDGMEYEVASIRCSKCGKIHALSIFFIKHREKIKERIRVEYFMKYGCYPADVQKEFSNRLIESTFTMGKSILE